MATLNDIYRDLTELDNAVAIKGGSITSKNLSPSMAERKVGIMSIPQSLVTLTGATISIVTAELPNRTITVKSSDQTQTIGTADTPATTGGMVAISVPALNSYRVICTESGVEKWNKLFTVSQSGNNYCKAGAFQDYTAAEIGLICDNNYNQLMWSIGDEYIITPFMGSTDVLYTTAKILDWGHYDIVGGGKSSMVLGFWQSPSSYKMANYLNQSLFSNKGSWTSSIVLNNCLKAGDTQYILDETVDSTTSGTYYTYDIPTNEFISVTLPAEYVEGTKYYVANVKTSDGAFISGLPADWQTLIKQFYCDTWTGATLAGLVTDTTLIRTKQWLAIPSAYEIFGEGAVAGTQTVWNGKGSWSFAKVQEGEQLEYYRTQFDYGHIFSGALKWLRSPNSSSSISFLDLDKSGYLSSSIAANSISMPLLIVI